ncbi:undecaprenyl diphosphate synthase [Methylomarinovum tepidoasis]|uniref:Ditrans,polycis-undecaprenyl-diphosphate synthase ((2E,6E)-farnesyl-diphosphate specific) n=1 Tax=Methylomarinovum tepidoasis TaxID=2840183 RepID=A0AAU9CBW9_9GAMM|nr:polyprenyl diphosphate synthase [Methylomarinovum sp. IN45]BCX88231.1 undecaprenyl diphosphate synthase [Methylomarinovum sp. IN45]
MTQPLPEESTLPRHVAIIMDGNGRWARRRHLPRTAGHQAGVTAVRKTVEYCARRGIQALTLFAFSSENWRRPAEEVSVLMRLFEMTLAREARKLDENGIRLRIIGDRSAFSPALQAKIAEAEALTAGNDRMTLLIAANYGGRWDIAQAARKLAREVAAGRLAPDEIDEEKLAAHLSFAGLPEPDLFIRTGGELRISNFLLWQLAYTELYFTKVLWPDFDEAELDKALAEYARRERRFGHTSEQLARRLSASSA